MGGSSRLFFGSEDVEQMVDCENPEMEGGGRRRGTGGMGGRESGNELPSPESFTVIGTPTDFFSASSTGCLAPC